jgi:hypothetical protein
MTIPASRIASVIPSVLTAAGSALDLNGLILSELSYVPIGTMMPFASAADVGAFFGLTSVEYQMAEVYFLGPNGATVTPGRLYFAQYAAAAVPAYLRGGSLSAMTLTQLQALSGTLTITSDGSPLTSGSISLSAATSFSNAATIITAAFTSPGFAVTFDAQHSAFLVTNTLTGVTSTIAFATGTIAAGLKLDAADGAVLSQGAAAFTPATAMPTYVAAAGDWASFSTTWEPVIADKTAFSLWTGQQNKRYVYAGYDTDPNAIVAGSTTTWAYLVEQAEDDGTIPIYGTFAHAALVMSWMASLNFGQTNGRSTLKFQTQSGQVPYVTDGTQAANLEANGYNYYGAFATSSQQFQFMSPGTITGSFEWADSYVNQIQFNADLQLALITLETSVGSIPYNDEGNTLIRGAITDPTQVALNFGTIRTGITLAQSQVQELQNAIGVDVSQSIYASGWYLDIKQASPAVRVARGSPPMTLYYTDGGSVQSLNLGSVEVQ